MNDETTDYVVVHPLLVDKIEVMIMPEVTRVLRLVYQVLSQPNYYLSKSGISSKRLSGPHLMKLKIMGIVNNDVKVCSYISKSEAMEIFNSFSTSNSYQYLNKIYWSNVIDIENEPVDNPKRQFIQTIKPELIYFIYENKSMVPWMSFLKMLSCENIESDQLTDEFIATIQNEIDIKILDNPILQDYLSRIEKIHYFGSELKYVSMEEIMDILIKLGISVTSLSVNNEKNKIRLLPPIYLDPENRAGIIPDDHDNNNNNTTIGSTNSNTQRVPLSNSDQISIDELVTMSKIPSNINGNNNIGGINVTSSNTVYVYELNNEHVIALPDIHKIIRKAQNLLNASAGAKSAQQRQVNYYLTKMRCKKGRFTFMQLKSIRRHGTPLGNATYCTFINKDDAISLFKIYSSLNLENPDVFNNIIFSEPIRLGAETCKCDNNGGNHQESCCDNLEILSTPSNTYLISDGKDNPIQQISDDNIDLNDKLLNNDIENILFQKYQSLKIKIKHKESQLTIINKYYKWKLKLLKTKYKRLNYRYNYIVDLIFKLEQPLQDSYIDDDDDECPTI